MPTKDFGASIPFYQIPGQQIWLPLVTVTLIQPNGTRLDLPMIFDTGASKTVLRHDLYPLLGVANWDVGVPIQTNTAGSQNPVTAYEYTANLEFHGKPIPNCPVMLQPLPNNPLWVGLFGRERAFEHFGFGFWESNHELLVTTTP